MASDGGPALGVDGRPYGLADLYRAVNHLDVVAVEAVEDEGRVMDAAWVAVPYGSL